MLEFPTLSFIINVRKSQSTCVLGLVQVSLGNKPVINKWLQKQVRAEREPAALVLLYEALTGPARVPEALRVLADERPVVPSVAGKQASGIKLIR